MARRTRTYVAFDADSDIDYYRMMQAWDAHDGIDFDFNNAHELTTIRPTSGEEAIKRSLRERMKNSKLFILLVGEKTKYQNTYVRWEIELALEAGLPIIVVNLNKSRKVDNDLCPAIVRNELAIHIPYGLDTIRHAIDNWPSQHQSHKGKGDTGAWTYKDEVYDKL